MSRTVTRVEFWLEAVLKRDIYWLKFLFPTGKAVAITCYQYISLMHFQLNTVYIENVPCLNQSDVPSVYRFTLLRAQTHLEYTRKSRPSSCCNIGIFQVAARLLLTTC